MKINDAYLKASPAVRENSIMEFLDRGLVFEMSEIGNLFADYLREVRRFENPQSRGIHLAYRSDRIEDRVALWFVLPDGAETKGSPNAKPSVVFP